MDFWCGEKEIAVFCDENYFWKVLMKKNILKLFIFIFLCSSTLSVFAYETLQKNNAILFVSLGMPKLALRQYVIQSEQLGIPLVIRGLLQNSYPSTAKRIYHILHPNNHFQKPIKGGFEIDPIYFKKFHIKVVPALVVISGAHSSLVYGNIPIKKLLQIIASNSKYSDVKNTAKSYLVKTNA